MSTSGQAEQTQFLYDIRCVDHGPLGLIDHLNLLPGGSTLRPVEHPWKSLRHSRGHVTKRKEEDDAKPDSCAQDKDAEIQVERETGSRVRESPRRGEHLLSI